MVIVPVMVRRPGAHTQATADGSVAIRYTQPILEQRASESSACRGTTSCPTNRCGLTSITSGRPRRVMKTSGTCQLEVNLVPDTGLKPEIRGRIPAEAVML